MTLEGMLQRAQRFVDRQFAHDERMNVSREEMTQAFVKFAALEVREAVGTKKTPRRVFICDECGKDPDCPMLWDHVWGRIARREGLLCIGCAERKLLRELTIADLRPCVGNTPTILMVKRATSSI